MLSPRVGGSRKRKQKILPSFSTNLKSYEADHEDATVPAVVGWLELSMELGKVLWLPILIGQTLMPLIFLRYIPQRTGISGCLFG